MTAVQALGSVGSKIYLKWAGQLSSLFGASFMAVEETQCCRNRASEGLSSIK